MDGSTAADTVGVVAHEYDDSDLALVRQVDVAELDRLLAVPVKTLVKNPQHVTHLLTRVRSTLAAAHETVAGMRRHIEQQQSYLARVGTPTTLNPLDAVRFLDDEQKELIFSRIARDRLANLRRLVDRAESERAAVEADLEVVRSVARALAEQTDLPPHVRAHVTRQLAALPRQVSPVHRPGMLDYPDLEPEPRETPPPSLPASGPVFPAPVAPAANGGPSPQPDPGPPQFRDPWGPTTHAPVRFVDPYAATSTQGDHR